MHQRRFEPINVAEDTAPAANSRRHRRSVGSHTRQSSKPNKKWKRLFYPRSHGIQTRPWPRREPRRYLPPFSLSLGWLIWLPGVTSPVKAIARPQRIPTGLGAIIPSRNRPSRNAPNASRASTSSQPIASAPVRTPETSSSLPANTSIIPRRRSSGQDSNQEQHINSLPKKIPHDIPSLPLRVDLGPTDGSKLTHTGGIRKIYTTSMKLRPDSHHPTSPQDLANTRPLDNQVSYVSPNDSFCFLFPTPTSFQPLPFRLPPPSVDFRDSAPVNFPLGLPPRPVYPNPPSSSSQAFGIPYLIRGKNVVLGMPVDDTKVRGTRGTFPKILEPPPSPSRSLVMEALPRKFRSESFILDWLSQFSFKPRRYELVEGKVFFEFEIERDAHLAWHSPRMGGLEGLAGVRLFWYRVLPQTGLKDMDTIRKVNTTRTIEDSAQSRPQPVSDSSTDDLGNHLGLRSGFKADLSHSHIPTQKPTSPPPSPPPSTVIGEDPGAPVNLNTPAESCRSNSDSQEPHKSSSKRFSGASFVSSPAVTTRPLAASTSLSDLPNNRMDYATMGDLPPGGVPGFIPGAMASPTVVSTLLSPTSSSSLTSPSTFPASPPEVLNSAVDAMSVDHQALSARDQGHMQASSLAAETFHVGTEVRGIQFEKVDGTPLGADDFMETSDTVALAKEQALREMVLQSRKRKLLETSNTKQPTSAPTSTAISRSALEDLATNFIADAIARPRPAKMVKITPSPAAMAAWGKHLEQHVESSKAIMSKIQSTRFKAERNRLLAVLREKDRCVSR